MTDWGTINLEVQRFIPQEFFERMTTGKIRVGDILIVKDGATTGKVAIVSEDFPVRDAAINEHVFLVRVDPSLVEPQYLFLWLWSSAGQTAIRSNYRGATIGGINQQFAGSIIVPLPPLERQREIASSLAGCVSAVRRAGLAMSDQLAACDQLASRFLQDVYSASIERWPSIALGEACDLLPARSLSTKGDMVVIAVTTACLSEDGFLSAGLKRARMHGADAAVCQIAAGEILVARSNTPELVGRASMYDGDPPGVVATDLTVRIATREGLAPSFLAGYLSYLFRSGYWRSRAGGASGTMKKITRSQLAALPIPLPDMAVQQRMVARVSSHAALVRRVQSAILDQSAGLGQLTSCIFARAFGGGA
jgi:hypothetical protein